MRDILFVTVDSLRADHVGAYGYDRDVTPNIDELAASGHTFTNAFANAGATRMSFPSILTGSSPLMYGGFEYISEQRTLVSEVLDEAGYTTGGLHSNPFLSRGFGYNRGFDYFYDSMSEPSLFARLRQYVKNNLNKNGFVFQTLKRTFDATERHAGVEVGSAYVRADELTDKAIDWLESTDSSQSVFLWVHYMDVHHPYVPPAEYQRAVSGEAISDRKAIRLRRKMLETPDEITDEELQQLIDLYDAEIQFSDNEVGRLVNTAREELANPVVLFTADHGEEFREHGQFSHNTLHDEGVHVPLVIEDGSEAATHDEVIALMDLPPTIATYAGVEPPENFYGHALQSLLEGKEWPREYVIGEGGDYEAGEQFYFYRDKRWKYIRKEDESLYDLESDPEERVDVSADNENVLADIRSKLDEREEEIDGTYERLESTEVNDEVEDRLEMLGYK